LPPGCKAERSGLAAKRCFHCRGVSSGEARGGMLVDALEDVDKVRVDVNAMQPTDHDQALHDADVFRTQFGPTEVPVFPPIGIARSERSRWLVSGGTSGR
jgi:hypothetical protein